MNVEFSNEEATLLRSLLDQAYRDLKEEVHKTETYTFKEVLVGQERMVARLLQKLGGPTYEEALERA